MVGPKNGTYVEFHISAECQQLCSLAHHVTSFFAQGNTERMNWFLSGGCGERKNNQKNKNNNKKIKTLKALQKSFL